MSSSTILLDTHFMYSKIDEIFAIEKKINKIISQTVLATKDIFKNRYNLCSKYDYVHRE